MPSAWNRACSSGVRRGVGSSENVGAASSNGTPSNERRSFRRGELEARIRCISSAERGRSPSGTLRTPSLESGMLSAVPGEMRSQNKATIRSTSTLLEARTIRSRIAAACGNPLQYHARCLRIRGNRSFPKIASNCRACSSMTMNRSESGGARSRSEAPVSETSARPPWSEA